MAENIKGKKPDSEKFSMKSKTNTIQYYNTEKAVQHMLSAGVDKQIMAQNMMASHEIDRGDVDAKSISSNDYRTDKFGIIDEGRRADKAIRNEMEDSAKNRRQRGGTETS